MNEYQRECDKGHSFAAPHPDDPCPVCAAAGLNPLPGGVRKTVAIYSDGPPVERNLRRRTVSTYADDLITPASHTSQHSRSHTSSHAADAPTVNVFQAAGFDGMPVVAWLVAVIGPLRGRDYRVPGGRSSFGRDPNSRIPLIGDDTISSNQGFINYTRSRKFSISPGDGTALIYINGQEVLNPMQLNPFDRIEVGRTTLLFVPFCGDQFDWTDSDQSVE